MPGATIIETAQGAATLVKPQGMTSTTWAVLAVLPFLAGILTALIKMKPAIISATTKARESRHAGLRQDMDLMRDELAALKVEVRESNDRAKTADERAHSVEMRMAYLNAAFQLVSGELARKDPDNPVLKQAREAVSMASSFDMDTGAAYRRLATVRSASDAKPETKS